VNCELGACAGCGALVPEVEGPTHHYIGASPGCWAAYLEVLEREYADFRYGRAHQLTVDAYCVQHPGSPSPQAIQSVAVHLIGLHLQLERGFPTQDLAGARQRAATCAKRGEIDFMWLEPPAAPGKITVLYLRDAGSPAEHVQRAREWAESAWEAWSVHHGTVRWWAEVL
jgi:hypothetical protein